MQYRTIGNRRTVSALCLGAMNFGSTTPPETATAILDRFVAAGGTFIDTSKNYNQWTGHGGDSEELLGTWMRSRGNRDQLTIATKCGARTTKPGNPVDAHWEGLSAPAVESAVKGSLERLGTDRIDLYYAHIDDRTTPQEETAAANHGAERSDGGRGVRVAKPPLAASAAQPHNTKQATPLALSAGTRRLSTAWAILGSNQ
jgi:aryl-alcohol dehydrogenase-like predicted oxidoreductase